MSIALVVAPLANLDEAMADRAGAHGATAHKAEGERMTNVVSQANGTSGTVDELAEARRAPGRSDGAAPTVTIGLPVYNGERYLERAVRSILEQDFTDFELLILDNASDDATGEIARRFAEEDPRVRYHRHPENLGASRNFGMAFEMARGRYFRWHAYDDWLEPAYLSRCVEVLDREPGVSLVFPGTNLYDEDGKLIRPYRHPEGLMSSRPLQRFFHSLWNWKYASAIFGLVRTEQLATTCMLEPYKGSDRILFSEMVLLGDVRELDEHLFNSTETVSVRRGRDHTWWTTEAVDRPTFDRWRQVREFLALTWRTPRFGLTERAAAAGMVLAFHCRQWPRRALLDEAKAGVRYARDRVTRPFRAGR